MNTLKKNIGNWYFECQPEDGGRISVLKYKGYDLLTTEPSNFKAPEKDYGDYENRPVYGYDDCFPTVEACNYPGEGFELKDHGDACWQSFKVNHSGNVLHCITELPLPGFILSRRLEFSPDRIEWHFEVTNTSSKALHYIHVMHPLMPLAEIASIDTGVFGEVYSETMAKKLDLKDSSELENHLLEIERGSFEMLFVRNLNNDKATIGFKSGLKMDVLFDNAVFPTAGIWWNNGGYPDEPGIRRTEFAFEPVPGICSNLEKDVAAGTYLSLAPKHKYSWVISWVITETK